MSPDDLFDRAPQPDAPPREEWPVPALDALGRDVALQALGESDAPIARADEIAAAVTGEALKATVMMRVEQIVKHGHDPKDDLMLPIVFLPNQAKLMAMAAHEAVMAGGDGRDLQLARRRLARTAALCWAAIDRIDAAVERKE